MGLVLFNDRRDRVITADLTMEDVYIYITLMQIFFVGSCFTYEFDNRFACDFSHDFCEWVNTNTSVAFIRNSGETTPDGTGPQAGHTDGGQDDYYIYLNKYGTIDNAELVSPSLRPTCAVACFRFWYHMYGRFVNKLEVGLINDANTLFVKEKESENAWKCGLIQIPSCNDKQIYIRAYESDEGAQSQIALDDLVLTYVDNAEECSTIVCDVNNDNFTTLRIPESSTAYSSSTTPTISITTAEFTPSDPTSTSTSEPLYLLGLLAVPFVVLLIGIVYIRKRKSKGDTSADIASSHNNNSNNRLSQDGYSPDPTTHVAADSPDGLTDHDYMELTEDLKRSDDDGGYLHPIERPDKGNNYENTKKGQYCENDINDGYLSAVEINSKKKETPKAPEHFRALPPLPEVQQAGAGKASRSQTEVESPPEVDNDDYLHPVTGKAPSMSTDGDDDYLKPTASVVIPSRLFPGREPYKQQMYDTQESASNNKRESSTTI